MRIILSRKGFDSGYGENPSPILPDGRILSLPIPRCEDELAYSEIRLPEGKTYDQIIEELGARSEIRNKGAHLDPDLVPGVRPRPTGWRPSLGHTLNSMNRAAELLEEYKVSKGDMFLFFGTFQHTNQWC